MTPPEVNKAADEMVQSFRMFVGTSQTIEGDTVNNYLVSKNTALKISIAHCKRVIEVLELSTPGTYTDYFFKKHRLILSELDGRVK